MWFVVCSVWCALCSVWCVPVEAAFTMMSRFSHPSGVFPESSLCSENQHKERRTCLNLFLAVEVRGLVSEELRLTRPQGCHRCGGQSTVVGIPQDFEEHIPFLLWMMELAATITLVCTVAAQPWPRVPRLHWPWEVVAAAAPALLLPTYFCRGR